jgi:hypothetical protein
MNKKMREKLERKKEERLRWIRIMEIMQIVNSIKREGEKDESKVQSKA